MKIKLRTLLRTNFNAKKEKNFECKKLLNQTITVYHATDELSSDLKRGYIGGDIKLYCSLSPDGLLELVTGRARIINGKIIKPERQDLGLFKIENVPIDWLYVDWETWSDIWYGERKRVYDWTPEALKVFEKIMRSRETDELVPLKDLYPLCKEVEEQFVKEQLGWIILPKGKRLYISRENIIT